MLHLVLIVRVYCDSMTVFAFTKIPSIMAEQNTLTYAITMRVFGFCVKKRKISCMASINTKSKKYNNS